MKLYELFNYILDEEIPISLAKSYMKIEINKNKYKEIFSKYTHDKHYNRIYLPFKNNPSHAPEIIIQWLNMLGYEVLNYQNGYAYKISDNFKRPVNIGKILNNIPQVKKIYDNDPNRQNKFIMNNNLLICISKHPYDIAGMSYNRKWNSCMDIGDGKYKHYVLQDIKHGSLIAYLISETDKNINNPYARILIKTYVNVNDNSKVIFSPDDQIYGSSNGKFMDQVKQWCENNSDDKLGSNLYCLPHEIFSDHQPNFDEIKYKK